MYAMFYSASSFDQVLCWNVTGVSNIVYMFGESPGSVNGACTKCVENQYRVDTTACA
eukprot:CAMPEP_0171929588 /NCGR_PEP_ID=MMETSP0993-20121228/27744_1 /TAXON_ID=483369 /ORGANISM="non described non described, Strain CCMP2098" /LENGTH=56 /DNA_ID=CAMNT_0012569151 /DNA_START=26 /DNA_END=193 /DNA_ORIENTATION=-